MTFSTQRFHPWLRVVLVAYLLCTVVITTMHQHHGALTTGDCGLCTVAHTPAVTAPTTYHPTPVVASRTMITVPDDRISESEFRQASRSRAPPQS